MKRVKQANCKNIAVPEAGFYGILEFSPKYRIQVLSNGEDKTH